MTDQFPEDWPGDAISVAARVLETIRKAYLARDFPLFAGCIRLPHKVGTFEGERMIKDADTLRTMFLEMCAHYETVGLIDLHRMVINAEFRGAQRIQATFLTRQILKGHVYGDEILGHGHLEPAKGGWQITESSYATDATVMARILVPRENQVHPDASKNT